MVYEFDKLKHLIKPIKEEEEIPYPDELTTMTEEPEVESKPIVVDVEKVKVTKPVKGDAIPLEKQISSNKDPFAPEARRVETEMFMRPPTLDPKKHALKNLAFRIGKLESSSGKNINHPIITDPKSMHYGDKAIGEHALMPKTIYDIAHRISKDKPEYDELRKMYKATSDEYDFNYDQDELYDYLINKRPDLYNQLFQDQLEYTHNKTGQNPELTAVAWLAGTEASPEYIKQLLKQKTPRGKEARERLHKYKAISQQMDPMVEKEVTPMLSPDSTYDTDQKKILDLMSMNYGPLQKLNPIQKGRFMELMKYMKKE